jgi:hypothetical protein
MRARAAICDNTCMDWASARERLGAELIGAREALVARWRAQLVEGGVVPRCLDRVASELVLQAGATLADEQPAHTPWTRAGGVLCVDANGGDRILALELQTLWQAMIQHVTKIAFDAAEERAADAALSQQLAAALRGAVAEVSALALDEPLDDASLRFGGVKLLCWESSEGRSKIRAA